MYRDNLEVNGPWITQHFPNLTAACVSGEAPDATRFQEMVGISYVAVLVRCVGRTAAENGRFGETTVWCHDLTDSTS